MKDLEAIKRLYGQIYNDILAGGTAVIGGEVVVGAKLPAHDGGVVRCPRCGLLTPTSIVSVLALRACPACSAPIDTAAIRPNEGLKGE